MKISFFGFADFLVQLRCTARKSDGNEKFFPNRRRFSRIFLLTPAKPTLRMKIEGKPFDASRKKKLFALIVGANHPGHFPFHIPLRRAGPLIMQMLTHAQAQAHFHAAVLQIHIQRNQGIALALHLSA